MVGWTDIVGLALGKPVGALDILGANVGAPVVGSSVEGYESMAYKHKT